jgi:small subunit ribosomal protein S17
MGRENLKTLTGVVTSDKMDKTITVKVVSEKQHPLYKKRIKTSNQFHAHDENEVAKIGDTVVIAETRPYSKTKFFRLLEVKEVAK